MKVRLGQDARDLSPFVALNLDLAGLHCAAGTEGGNATHIVAGWRCLFATSISAGSIARLGKRQRRPQD